MYVDVEDVHNISSQYGPQNHENTSCKRLEKHHSKVDISS
jgi:hypothetical protein